MDKNNLPPQTVSWRSSLALLCLLGMIGGLLFSRAMVSVCMMLFGIVSLWGIHPRAWLRQRWWLLGLGWIALYALSYFWSTDKGMWSEHVQVKLPFLLLPLSFGLLPAWQSREWKAYTIGLTLIMLSGASWSASFLYGMNTTEITETYRYARVLRTPMYDDHIAFSTAVAVTVAWIICSLPLFAAKKWQQGFLILAALLLAIYLHVLAAKTGLLALYVFLLGFIIWQLRRRPAVGLSLLITVTSAVWIAFQQIPTLRERFNYSKYTWEMFRQGERSGNYSDAGRIFSYDIALRKIVAHPYAGVGAGDVFSEMQSGYAQWYPAVGKDQQLWPHNQWLTCAMAAGIPAALLFTWWLLAVFGHQAKKRGRAFLLLVWLMLLVPLLVDAFLEVQFGVAVFLIFLLVQRKWSSDALSK